MADEPLKPDPTSPAAVAPVASPAAAPVAEAAAAAPAPAPTPAAADAAPQHPSQIPSLLEELIAPGVRPTAEAAPAAVTPDGAKPVVEGEKKPAEPAAAKSEAPKPGEAKPAETAPAVAAPVAPAIVVADLKLPEGFKAIPEQMEGFANLLGAADLPPMERAQKLLDLHTSALKDYATAYDKAAAEAQVRVFNETRAGWRKQIMADPQLGGSGYETASKAIARMRDMFVSRAEYGSTAWNADMKEFVDFLRSTGAGDHPAFHRMLHNVARVFDEPGMPPPNPKPPPDIGRNPNRPNGIRVMYRASATAK